MSREQQKKRLLVLGMQLSIAFFFVVGARVTHASWLRLYHCYFADLAIPFAFYFLLSISAERHAVFKPWWIKALMVFALCTTSEILQYFGIFALARTFDPLDIVMYGMGVLLAIALERGVLAPRLAFWD